MIQIKGIGGVIFGFLGRKLQIIPNLSMTEAFKFAIPHA